MKYCISVIAMLAVVAIVASNCKNKKSAPEPVKPEEKQIKKPRDLSELRNLINTKASDIAKVDSIVSIDSNFHLGQGFYTVSYLDSTSIKYLALQADSSAGGLLKPIMMFTCLNLKKTAPCKIALVMKPKEDAYFECPCNDSSYLAAQPFR